MIRVKDGAKLALGFLFVKGAVLIGSAIALAVLEAAKERLEDKLVEQRADQAARDAFAGKRDPNIRAFKVTPDGTITQATDAPWNGIDVTELFPGLGEALSKAAAECTNPDCILHGKGSGVFPFPFSEGMGIQPSIPEWERRLMDDATGKTDNED